MPWQQIEASVAHLFVRKARAGVAMPDLDLFGEAPVVIGRKSNAGRPRVALRIMIALLATLLTVTFLPELVLFLPTLLMR